MTNRFLINLDAVSYHEKPKDKLTIGGIRKRLGDSKSITEVTMDELMAAIENGQTFTPSVMTGTTGNTWQSQQIIAADIDNEWRDNKTGQKEKIPCPVSPNDALQILSDHGIQPACMYYSFSSSDEWQRFRILIRLSEPVTDVNISMNLTGRLLQLLNEKTKPFNCSDTTVKDAARLLFGSRKGSVIYSSDAAYSAEELAQKLPPLKAKKEADSECLNRKPLPLDMSDSQIIKKAAAANDAFTILYAEPDGWERLYISHSEADMRLCGILAFWCNRDPVAIDRIFRSSVLYRPKWDEKRPKGGSYGNLTIAKACAGCSECWGEWVERMEDERRTRRKKYADWILNHWDDPI